MKRKIFIFFLFLSFLFISRMSYAKEVTGVCGDNASYTFDEQTGTMTISGYGRIYQNWSEKTTADIRRLIIEEGITNTGKNSFQDAVHLTDVHLPDSLTEISDDTFSGCISLKSILIPKNVTKKAISAFTGSYIEEAQFAEGSLAVACQLFANCKTLKKVTLADSIRTIRASAFRGCSNLSIINIPDKLEEIHYDAFRDCEALKEIIIPGTVKSGGTNCFAGSGLEKITLENGITNIPSEIFSGCRRIRQIELPDSVKSIGYAAFSDCDSLTISKLPPHLTEIGNNAFYQCKSIIMIELPSTLTRIGDYAFFGTGLDQITISPHIASIGYYAFNRNTVIHGEDETQAEVYVRKFGNPYIPVRRSMKNVTVADIPNQGHTGRAVMPQLTVTDGNKVLRQNVNYRLTYHSNIGFGTARVTVTGIDSYYFGSKTETFLIIAPQGGIYRKGNLKYKVTDSRTGGKGAVEVAGVVKQKKSIIIPKTVKIGKYNYRVSSIGSKAFYKKKKIKKITISSTAIKKIGSRAVRGIYKKARIKVPKSKKKSYKKMLKKAGLGKKNKVV